MKLLVSSKRPTMLRAPPLPPGGRAGRTMGPPARGLLTTPPSVQQGTERNRVGPTPGLVGPGGGAVGVGRSNEEGEPYEIIEDRRRDRARGRLHGRSRARPGPDQPDG